MIGCFFLGVNHSSQIIIIGMDRKNTLKLAEMIKTNTVHLMSY